MMIDLAALLQKCEPWRRLARWLIHLKAEQIAWRAYLRLQRLVLSLPKGRPLAPLRAPHDSWPGDAENGRRIQAGSIRLLHLDQILGSPVDWRPADKSALWRFTLHYFDWLGDLRAAGDAPTARRLVLDWIKAHPKPKSEAWHAYPLSLRLFAWLRHAPFLLENCDADFREAFLSSLDQHAIYLPWFLERDVGGNHLIKNLKAQVAAALCLPAHAVWLEPALAELRKELALQILPDGFHFERSPSYHLQVLIDLLDLQELLAQAKRSEAWLDATIALMGPALATLRHPDGGLALFNDGEVGDPRLLAGLDARLGPQTPKMMLPKAGYARLEAGGMVAIFDAGPCCPDHLTAHAHADALSFEFSIGRQRVIVNSGTFAYQDAAWRNRLRGTAAHSTIEVKGEDSAELFGVFRIGRRPRNVELAQEGGWLVGRHDGYRHLGIIHERKLRLTENGLEGQDRLIGPPVPAKLRFHVHPESPKAGPIGLGIEGKKLTESPGVWSPFFHVRMEARTFSADLAGGDPPVTWQIVKGSGAR
jgi:uncharacterized heparinase superfamily protein